jgi:flagellin
MANIGATTAFFKVETALTRANAEVGKSMERLATGNANAIASDRSSYVAMSDTFRMDYSATKAGIKGASVVMGYLETGMRVIDAGSALLAKLNELAVLGANGTNTTDDADAIDAEAQAIATEFNRLMFNSTYKNKNVFALDGTAKTELIAVDARGGELKFGIGKEDFVALCASLGGTLVAVPSDGSSDTDALTALIVTAQGQLNTMRVQAGSQYAAIESAMNYSTDLTAQYELGYNTVYDVNFSMETAHLAKNQILQQAATAMLAQANRGQQGLLQLLQS